MAPKRKAEELAEAAPKGKKTTVSKKTTVTTVTIEEPEKKRKTDSIALMPLELPSFQIGALSGISSASSCGGGGGSSGKYVWLIYHKSGRHDAQLMGVYTGARTALKNAKAVIDKETGGAKRRMLEGADLSDLSSNMQADHGVVYEVKHRNGGKNVVSFKKVKLNEDLSGDDEAHESRLPGMMGSDRGAIGWM